MDDAKVVYEAKVSPEEADQMVLGALARMRGRGLVARRFADICEEAGVSMAARDGRRWRALDRAMQRLRKRGEIKLKDGRWSLAKRDG